MLLELEADGNTLETKGASFNLTLRSPVVESNSGSYIFTVTIPYSPQNAKVFGFPFRLTRMDVLTATKSGRIIYNGIHIQKGEWKAKTSMAKTINLEMVIGSGHFSSLVDGKKLVAYFDVETVYADIVAHINSQVSKTYPEVNHQFQCIYNPSFYGDANESFSGVMNDYADGFIDDIPNHTNIVPQLYLLYIIVKLFESQAYAANGNVLDDTYLQKATLYNNFAIDKVESVYFYAEAYDDIVLSTYEILWDTNIVDPQSNYTASTGNYRATSAGTYKIDLNITSHLYDDGGDLSFIAFLVIEILYDDVVIRQHVQVAHTPEDPVRVILTHNHTVTSATINRDFSVRIFYTDDETTPYVSFVDEGNITIVNEDVTELNAFGDTINYKNHVPNMDVKNFLKEFYNAFKILPFFDHRKKTVELVFLRDLLESTKQKDLSEGLVKNTLKVYANTYEGLTFKFDFQGPDNNLDNNFIEPETLTGTIAKFAQLPVRPTLGDIYFITNLNAYYKYSYTEPEEETDPGIYSWLPWGDKHPEVIYDDGKKPITTALAPMLMRCHKHPTTYNLRNMPSVDATGTSEAFGVENDFPLRVMFYTGLSQLGNLTEYPLASTTKSNTEGSTILPIDHKWEDVITRYFVPVIAWWKTRQKVEFTNLVSPAFIAVFDFQDKYFFQKTKVLFEEVVVKIKSKMFGPGKFRGWS